jgi:hypothetical protein
MELEQSHRAEVSRMHEKFESEKQAWLEVQRMIAEQVKIELNSLLEVEKNTQETLAWTSEQLNNHKTSIQELVAELQALKTSTSWRMTEPLRALLRKISG